jgi:S-layer homology domain
MLLLYSSAMVCMAQYWARTYGASENETVSSFVQTSDSGFMVAGVTNSMGAGANDLLLIKLNSLGSIQWQKTIGGGAADYSPAVLENADGTFIIAATAISFGNGSQDIWVIKLNATGNILWQKIYQTTSNEVAVSIAQDATGGYLIGGAVFSSGVPHALLVKIDGLGAVQWQKTYGGTGADYISSVKRFGNDYIICGYTASWGHGGYDFWMFRVNATGTVVWQKTYGGALNDMAIDFEPAGSTGYLVVGSTESFATNGSDFWIIKINTIGDLVWQKHYHAGYGDRLYSIKTTGSNFVATGRTDLFGTEYWDLVVMQLDGNGGLVWQKMYGGVDNDSGYSMIVLADSSLMVAGYTDSFGMGNSDIWLLHTDSTGSINASCTFISNLSVSSADTAVTLVNSSATATTAALATSVSTANSLDASATILQICPVDYIELSPYLGKKPAVDDSISPPPLANGIIEADEQVVLLGHLQNTGTEDAVNTLGNLITSDPVSIIQPDANYGLIAAASHKECSMCYVIKAPASNRTNTHWDFDVTEDVTADGPYGPVSFDYTYHVGNSFSDVLPGNIFYSYIETVLHNTVTSGCTASTYCPNNIVQRQQLAKFVCRSMNILGGGSCPASGCSGIFSDVPGSNTFCPDIEALYNLGVVSGCQSNPLLYCPGTSVQRQSMAKFVCLGMEQAHTGACTPGTCQAIFADVNSTNPFCIYIEALYNAGVINGCSASTYCPYNNVSRGQMAKFLVNGFQLAL